MAQTERSTTTASTKMISSINGLGSAYQSSVASIHAAIQANTAYAQSLKSIEAAARSAQRVTSASILGGRALGGAGAESVASLRAGIQAGAAYAQSMASITEATRKFQAQTKETTATTGLFGGSLRSLAGAFGLLSAANVAVRVITAVATSFKENVLAMDATRLSLVAVTGSTTAASREMLTLQAIADKTGVSVITLSQQWAGLFAAVNQVPGRLEITRDIFSALIETSARMGKSQEQVGLALYGLTQIAGGATLQLQDFNQIVDALPGIFPALSTAMGYTQTDFRKLIGEGKILVDEMFPKLHTSILSLAKGDGPVSSLRSELGRLSTAWTNLMDALGQMGIVAVVSVALQGLTGSLRGVTAALKDAKAAVFGAEEATIVANSMQQIRQQMDETTASITNMEKASTTGVGGLINRAMGLDQTKALETQRQRLTELTAAYEALKQSNATAPGLPALSASEKAYQANIAALKGLDKTAASTKESIAKLNLELSALQSKDVGQLQAVGLDPLSQTFEQERKARITQILKDRQELQDKLLGIDRKAGAAAAKESGQSAVEIAKAREDALATGLKREEALIQQSADEQRRIVDQTASEALITGGPGDVEAIAAEHSKAIRQIAIDEAKALEAIRLDTLQQQAVLREATLKADIAAAGKNLSAQVKAQEELKNLHADTEAERAKITKQRTDVEQQISKKSVDDQIKDARELNTIKQEIEQDRLQSSIDLADDQIALIEAQVDGEVITYEDGALRIRAIQEQRLETTRQLYISEANAAIAAIDLQVRETDKGKAEIAKIQEGLNNQLRGLDVQRQTESQAFLNKQAQDYERFSERVVDFLDDIFQGLLKGTLNAVDFFKNLLIRSLSNIASNILGPLIASLSASVVGIVGSIIPGIGQAIGMGAVGALGGGGGGGGGGGALETGGMALTGIGLAKQLYSFLGIDSLVGSVRTGFGVLQETFLTGIDSLFGSSFSAANQAAAESALLLADATGDMGRGVAGAAGGGMGAALGIAGGLAALGGGIYAALNASNAASKAAFAASAAAGAAATAVAAYGAITGAAVVTAGGTGWTGIGLIVAAVMAVIGTVLDKVIKPEGPTVAVGAPGGLNVGTADGKLQLQGDAGSRVFRREGVDREFAQGIQAQLEEGITAAAIASINTINAVALDPEALLGPTQDALQNALDNISTINSSNAKKMEQDITEQLRFANMQMVGGLLEPINLAFDQLRDMGDLEEQIEQLPGKTSGLLAIFTNLRTQLDEIGASRNTDVLRQLSAVRNQVENFGNRIAGTAAQVAESIVTQTIEAMKVDVAPKLADQITQFSGLMDESFRALNTLRATKTMLEGAGLPGGGVGQQADRLTMAMSEQAGRIATEIVTGALDDLKTELDQVLVQPIAIQATTVNSLFTDSQAALAALWKEWHRLEEAGLDATAIQGEFERLLGGVIQSTFTVLKEAFDPSEFSEFLAVLLAIPPELAKMNPELEKLRNIGATFAQVVGPNAQRIQALEASLRTPAQAAEASAQHIADLRSAIADAGDAADKALPLYGQLSAAIVAQAEQQIQAIQEIAQAWEQAMEQVDADIASFEDALGGMGTQLTRAIIDMRVSADAFNQAVSSGETLAAIEAIHEYEQAVIAVAELQIQAIQEIAQAWQSAMDQVLSDIATLEGALHGVGSQLTNAIIDMRVNADAFNQAVARGDTLGAIEAIHAYEQAVVEVGNLQIRQIQEHRQATIDAQQAIIDGLQRQADAQQDVIDAIDEQIDAQESVIEAWQDQIDAQQDVIDSVQEIIAYRQEELTEMRRIEDAMKDRVDSLRQEEQALISLRDRVDDRLRQAQSPAEQEATIRRQLAETEAQLPGATGEEAIKLLEKMVHLNEELMQLGDQTDNLAYIKEGTDNLRKLQEELNKRLADKTKELDIAYKQFKEAEATRIAAEAQLKILEEWLKYEERVRKSLEERKQYEEHVRDHLVEQREYQQDVLENINDQIEVQRDILAQIEASTYWDEQIAAVQQSVLDELYNVRLWLAGVQGPTTWEQQIAAIQQSVLDELYNVRLWLSGVQGETTWEQQIREIQYYALIQLIAMQQDLANIFRVMVGQSPIFAQRGGIMGLASGLHYAQGGMVPAMLEPGEKVLSGPFSMAQQGALMAVNQAFPRFASGGWTVPGSGSGDTVPSMVPSGSFVMNRNASGAMGYQGGGSVQGSPPSMPPIVIDLRGSHFSSPDDARKVKYILEREVVRIMDEQKRKRGDTRLGR